MLFLTEDDVRGLLPMPEAIRLMRMAFKALARNEAQSQPRRRLILPGGSILHSMAGAYGGYFGTKFYSTNPKHGAHFLFALYDAKTADPRALMQANYLGQIRTGATTGYAADLLAAPDATIMAVIGSGFQAAAQIEAVRAVRPIREVRVWSRTSEKRERFARETGSVAAGSADAAVRGASIVVTATNAKEPVIEAGWISPGAFISAVGSNNASRRELPPDLLAAASLVAVDSLEQAQIEAGDLILAANWANVVELQTVTPRHNPAGIAIFKSVGLGVEDVAAGSYVYERALERGAGKALYS